MKPVLTITLATVAALGIGLSPATLARAASPPPKTQSALACLIGLGRDGCEADFARDRQGPWVTGWHDDPVRSTTHCTGQYAGAFEVTLPDGGEARRGECQDGPLETVEYLGINSTAADVYLVKYRRRNTTYVIPRPTSDGKIHGFWIKGGSPNQIVPQSLVAVSSPAHQLLYSRHG